jgi:hypothetical protein
VPRPRRTAPFVGGTGVRLARVSRVGLFDPNDRWRDIVAKAIIEAAQAGERDTEPLRDRGVRAVS